MHSSLIKEGIAFLSAKTIPLLQYCHRFNPVSYPIIQRYWVRNNQHRTNTSLASVFVLISSVQQINCPYAACDIRQGVWTGQDIKVDQQLASKS